MKTYKISGFRLLLANNDGVYDEVVGYVTTEKLAKEWMKTITNWPHTYEAFTKIIRIAETLDELKKRK